MTHHLPTLLPLKRAKIRPFPKEEIRRANILNPISNYKNTNLKLGHINLQKEVVFLFMLQRDCKFREPFSSGQGKDMNTRPVAGSATHRHVL